jgi:segregation and condensation protein A
MGFLISFMEIGPIDMLMSLVFAREVDPWNIDIVDLTQRYLEQIRRLHELDLRLSGKTILVASILLRMQSDEFFKEKKEEHEEVREGLEFVPSPIIPPLRRKEGKITLPELLNALLRVLEEYEKKEDKERIPQERALVRLDIHRTDIRKFVEELYRRLDARGEDVVKFSDLLDDNSSLAVCRVFLYLLFLELEHKVELWQKKEFDEIYINVIRKSTPAAG